MSNVPPHELATLRSLSGYEQMLEMDRVCRQYNTDEDTLRTLLSQNGEVAAPAGQHQQPNTPASWDTSHKDVPQLNQATPPSVPTMVNKEQFRFEFDPTREERRQSRSVGRSLLCLRGGAGVLPSVRSKSLPIVHVRNNLHTLRATLMNNGCWG